ncbi:DedA family protein [Novosphingobium lentum]|uniref:DedA family protein n=1 Tax=Novosphingobium lentum TaxID=145287 RepID=UPI00082EE26D|nr:DedA family protein [Novosphingobium lentum]
MTFSLDSLIHQFGAIGVGVGAGLEGETAVVIGGILARHGSFSPVAAALAAWLGSFIADQGFFLLGRWRRQSKLVTRIAAKPTFARALAMIETHPIKFCVAFRFIYGFRMAGPMAIGVSKVPARLFLALNLVSAAVWAAAFTSLGYSFGLAFEKFLRRALSPLHVAMLVTVVGSVALVAILIRNRRRLRAETQGTPA